MFSDEHYAKDLLHIDSKAFFFCTVLISKPETVSNKNRLPPVTLHYQCIAPKCWIDNAGFYTMNGCVSLFLVVVVVCWPHTV